MSNDCVTNVIDVLKVGGLDIYPDLRGFGLTSPADLARGLVFSKYFVRKMAYPKHP
jgi:hypothetical protein